MYIFRYTCYMCMYSLNRALRIVCERSTEIRASYFRYMCPHPAICVSSSCYVCVLSFLYMRARAAIYASSYYCMCPHPAIYVSSSSIYEASSCYICVRILLHTSVLILPNMRQNTGKTGGGGHRRTHLFKSFKDTLIQIRVSWNKKVLINPLLRLYEASMKPLYRHHTLLKRDEVLQEERAAGALLAILLQ